jgi:hypothetical protein
MSYREPDVKTRLTDAAAAKKAMLERFRAGSEDPDAARRQAERAAIHEARLIRVAEREAARVAREAELAAEAARAAEAALLAQQEAEKNAALALAEEAERAEQLLAEQKAERDARYAARKAAKKQRRKG